MLAIVNFMETLARVRPIFHSEADFQHEFAWQLHQKFPNGKVRLERPFQIDKWIFVDIWLETNTLIVAFELNYKTASLEFEDNAGEGYYLKNQAAHDPGRYDFLKDVCRLEQIVRQSPKTVGFAIMLTNDRTYWKPAQLNTFYWEFRLEEGREIADKLQWSKGAAPGTIKSRSEPLELQNQYQLHWADYANLSNGKKGQFRYLALEMPAQTG